MRKRQGSRRPRARLSDPRGPWTWIALGGLLALLAGCGGTPARLFEPVDPPVVWPPEPAAAKIRYVGELRTSADLKPSRNLFQAIGSLLSGEAEPEALYGPRGVACSEDGRFLWVADLGGRCLHRFDLESRAYQKITHAGPTALVSPVNLCPGPEDTLYVCESEGRALHRFSASRGEWLASLSLPAELLRPADVACDPVTGTLYVADVKGHDVKVLDPAGRLRRTIGRRGTGRGEFNFPTAVHLAGDRLWVVDTGNHRIQGLTAEGEPRVAFGQVGDAPGDLALPKDICSDRDGNLYVVDARFENVQIFDPRGQLLLFFGSEGSGPGQFWLPAGIFIDSTSRIWVCDTYNRRLQAFDYIPGRRE